MTTSDILKLAAVFGVFVLIIVLAKRASLERANNVTALRHTVDSLYVAVADLDSIVHTDIAVFHTNKRGKGTARALLREEGFTTGPAIYDTLLIRENH